MPEMTFTVTWPDGQRSSHYSPSLVVHDTLAVGECYPVADFRDRTLAALEEGSERVRARYGRRCSAAAAESERIIALAASFTSAEPGVVQVLAMDPGPAS